MMGFGRFARPELGGSVKLLVRKGRKGRKGSDVGFRNSVRCANYAFTSPLRGSLGRSLRDSVRCANYAFTSPLRGSLGQTTVPCSRIRL